MVGTLENKNVLRQYAIRNDISSKNIFVNSISASK
jgi:hypothetical protein